jgi:hypothetical protein
MHKIVAGIEQKKIVEAWQSLVTGPLTNKSSEAIQHCFEPQATFFQIAIADYGVVSTCYVYAISVAQQ